MAMHPVAAQSTRLGEFAASVVLVGATLATFARAQTNVLVIVLDDVGVDKVEAYGLAPNCPPTPTLSALASQGVLFRNAYAQPVCSPTRASALTGRPPFLHGIGRAISQFQDPSGLSQSEVTLAELLDLANTGYATTMIGKWHLGCVAQWDALDPLLQGFDHALGTRGNLIADATSPHYFNWVKFVDGVQVVPNITNYATSETIDDAIAQMAVMPQPWFLWLAIHAPHEPWHAPPQALHTYTLPTPPSSAPDLHYGAALQAVDTELARMLPNVPVNTTLILFGDNGTPRDAVLPPFDLARSKGTMYEGGIKVPLIVTGPLVQQPGSDCDALVHASDLFATVAEIAGVFNVKPYLPTGRRIDSVSFVPYLADPTRPSLRQYVYSERFSWSFGGQISGLWQQALRDSRWKLIQRPGFDEFFDLTGVEIESHDLLLGSLSPEEQDAYARLKQAMREIVSGKLTDSEFDVY